MDDGDAIFQTLVDSPDDTIAPLVYADWLQENGEPERAEFTRLQAEAARCRQEAPGCEPSPWRERELLAHHWRSWFADIQDRVGSQPLADCHNGMLVPTFTDQDYAFASFEHLDDRPIRRIRWDRISSSTVRALAGCERLTPFVSLDASVYSLDIDPTAIAELVRSPVLRNLRHLRFDICGIDSETAIELANSPYLSQLRELRLPNNRIGPEGVEAFVRSPHLSNLQILDLESNPCEIDEAMIIRIAERWPQLRELNLKGNPLYDSGIKALTRCDLPHLRSLNIGRCHLTAGAMAALVDSGKLAQFTKLDLDALGLGGAGIKPLLSVEQPIALRWLNLTGPNLDAKVLRRLAEWQGLRGLRYLRIDRNVKIGLDAWEYFFNSPNLTSLVELDFGFDTVTNDLIERLARSQLLERLESLHCCGLDPIQGVLNMSGVQALARASGSRSLRSLNFRWLRLSDEVVRKLIESPNLMNLQELCLNGSRIGPTVLKELIACERLPNLHWLDVRNTPAVQRTTPISTDPRPAWFHCPPLTDDLPRCRGEAW